MEVENDHVAAFFLFLLSCQRLQIGLPLNLMQWGLPRISLEALTPRMAGCVPMPIVIVLSLFLLSIIIVSEGHMRIT